MHLKIIEQKRLMQKAIETINDMEALDRLKVDSITTKVLNQELQDKYVQITSKLLSNFINIANNGL